MKVISCTSVSQLGQTIQSCRLSKRKFHLGCQENHLK